MATTEDTSAVQVIDGVEPPRSTVRRLPLLIISAVALGVFAVQVVVFSDTGDPAPTEVIDDFVAAFNEGDLEALNRVLAGEPSVLSWPAGPPWGGGLQWTIELVPEGGEARLTHAASLVDYLGFHHALAGKMRVEFCAEEARRRRLDERVWVRCSFSVVNELSSALDPDSPFATGVVRFGIEAGGVEAVVVEDVIDPAPSGIPFLLWVQVAHPDVFESLLGGRITLPDYRASTGRTLLELARRYEGGSG